MTSSVATNSIMLNFVKLLIDLSFFFASDVLITEKPTIVGIRRKRNNSQFEKL